MGRHLYSIQTVASLLTRFKYYNQNALHNKIQISLLNVNTNPNDNEELNLMHGLLDIVNFTSSTFTSKNKNDNIQWSVFSYAPKLKEMYDYANIMKYYHVNRTECDNVLLLEDDSIASHDWYEKICNALNKIQSQSFSSSKWLCLKLFTSFRYYDFFIHLPTVLNIIFYSFLFTLVQMLILLKLSRHQSRTISGEN
jgi:hypothetical protein